LAQQNSQSSPKEEFTNVQPIGEEKFSDVQPIEQKAASVPVPNQPKTMSDYGHQFVNHMMTGVNNLYPVRLAKLIMGSPEYKKQAGPGIMGDAARDFALSGVPEEGIGWEKMTPKPPVPIVGDESPLLGATKQAVSRGLATEIPNKITPYKIGATENIPVRPGAVPKIGATETIPVRPGFKTPFVGQQERIPVRPGMKPIGVGGEGAPTMHSPSPTFIPEPRPEFAGEVPNYMGSVPREELEDLALRRKPGAGKQMQQLGKPIIYIPTGSDLP
jgi:hypothetical protein